MITSGDGRRASGFALFLFVFLFFLTFGSDVNTAFANPAKTAGESVAANGIGTPFELSFWQSVDKSDDPAQYGAYLAQYPDGTFSGLARAKIAALAPAIPASVPSATLTNAAMTSVPLAAASPPLNPPASTGTAVAVPAAAFTTATAAGATGQPPSLLDQLSALGKGEVSNRTALFTATGSVPPRPELALLNAPAMPDHFCSAVERNAFHDHVYVAAVAQADRNNEATIGHLNNVQALHAQAIAANNISGANALAHEAILFKPVADQAYTARAAMTELFARIMAIPVTGC